MKSMKLDTRSANGSGKLKIVQFVNTVKMGADLRFITPVVSQMCRVFYDTFSVISTDHWTAAPLY